MSATGLLGALLVLVGACSSGKADPRTGGGVRLSDSTPEQGSSASTGAVAGLPLMALRLEAWDPPVSEGPTGSLIFTENYQMYTTLEDGWLYEKMPAFLETALEHYRTSVIELSKPNVPLETYIFSERNQWQAFTRLLLPGEAGIYLSLGKGGFTTETQAVLYDIGRWDTLCITAHEGWHQFAQASFSESLPAWFDEGMATWMEGCRFERSQDVPTFMPWRNFERFNELRRCARIGRMYPLFDLLNQSPQYFLKSGREHLLAYYAQVWAFMHFLMEGEDGRYRSGVERVLEDARDGRLGRTMASSPQLGTIADRRRAASASRGLALAIVYFNSDLDELENEYRSFLEKVMGRGSGSAVARGRSPIKPDEPTN
jgi:hypothetical protein